MKQEIANTLYETKYKTILSKERFAELLERGLNLIHEKGLGNKYKAVEQNALEVGLDYITAEMIQH
ncbi:MAG: hypothetical protein JNK00_03045 [Flavipsychrobacter sp.]|nr:hypothetical protein [Flavipsychrobacter sp.]